LFVLLLAAGYLVLCLPPLHAIPAHCQHILPPPTTVKLVWSTGDCLILEVKIVLAANVLLFIIIKTC